MTATGFLIRLSRKTAIACLWVFWLCVFLGLCWMAAVFCLGMPLAHGQSVDVNPSLVVIPRGQAPLEKWPLYEANPACGHVTLTVTYTAGAGGIAAGGGLELGLGYPTGNDTNAALAPNGGAVLGPSVSMSKFPVGAFQATTPAAANYCTASCANAALVVSTVVRPYGGETVLRILAPSGIPAGAPVTITLGATGSGGPGLTYSFTPGRPHVVVLEDAAGTGTFAPTAASLPRVLFTAGAPDLFVVTVGMTPLVDVPTRITVRALQHAPGGPYTPCEVYKGAVHFESTDLMAALPVDRAFTTVDRGVIQGYVTFHALGPQTITVREVTAPGTYSLTRLGMSNTAVVQASTSDVDLMCGDFQRHACEGGHAAMTDRFVWRQLYEDGFDFGTVIQHSAQPLADFAYANQVAATFQANTDPYENDFVAFPGYEWTLAGAHRHVVYADFTTDRSLTHRNWTGAAVPGPEKQATTQAFLDRLATMPSDADHVAIPHHTLWNGHDDRSPDAPYEWGRDLDASVQPVVEIYSGHGSSERWLAPPFDPWSYPIAGDASEQRPADQLASVQDALVAGYRFGFVGGSDRHAYGPLTGGDDDNPDTAGCTVLCASRAQGGRRAGGWAALRARHTYATTGARIHASMLASDGAVSGDASATPSFSLTVHTSSFLVPGRPSIRFVEIVRDAAVLVTYAPGVVTDLVGWTFTDPAPITDHHAHAYYARVVQSDDQVAWLSPIYVTVP